MIRVNGVSFAYGERQVLHDISFSLAKGQLAAVLGINGSGKSTLLKTINGLLQPASGSITLDDQEIGRMSRRQLARTIAYLPQTASAVDCTVFEAVLIGRKPHLGWQVTDHDLAETFRMLELTGLTGYADRITSTLSGGELQRVAIARTLAQQPSLLLLDEPVNHLDIRSQLDIMALIRSLTSQLGIITLAVMHDLNMALRFSDHFLLMSKGTVLATGGHEVMTPENIRDLYQLQVVLHEVDGIPLVVPCPDQEPSRLNNRKGTE